MPESYSVALKKMTTEELAAEEQQFEIGKESAVESQTRHSLTADNLQSPIRNMLTYGSAGAIALVAHAYSSDSLQPGYALFIAIGSFFISMSAGFWALVSAQFMATRQAAKASVESIENRLNLLAIQSERLSRSLSEDERTGEDALEVRNKVSRILGVSIRGLEQLSATEDSDTKHVRYRPEWAELILRINPGWHLTVAIASFFFVLGTASAVFSAVQLHAQNPFSESEIVDIESDTAPNSAETSTEGD